MKIIVFSDGSTYQNYLPDGILIMELTEEGNDFLDEGGDPSQLEYNHIISEIALTELLK